LNLNETHIELLKKVRERMMVDAKNGMHLARPYLCWNILSIGEGLSNIPRGRLFNELILETSEDIRMLIEAIESAIDGHCTFCGWFASEVDILGLNISYSQAKTMGRLAWLDKMIETRVIA
jgi:hypothetical protein